MAFLGIGPEGIGGAFPVIGEKPIQRRLVIINQGGGQRPRGQGRVVTDEFDFEMSSPS